MRYRVLLSVACAGRFSSHLGAVLVTPFYSRMEAQGRYMYLLRGVFCLAEATCLSPAACHCGGMVGGAVLSSVHWSDAAVTPYPVRRGSFCGGPVGAPSSVGDVLVTVGLTGAESQGRVDATARVR